MGHVANISIRELRYKSFRFYFILDGHRLCLFSGDQTEELLIRFVAASKKNDQQKVIAEIKQVLEALGLGGLH